MKTILTSFVLCFTILITQAQPISHFAKTIKLEKSEDGDHIVFSVCSEANIKCYIIEGSTDSLNYEFVRVIKGAGNTVIPRTYDFYCMLDRYKAYRIKQLDTVSACLAIEVIGFEPVKLVEPSATEKDKVAVRY